MKYGIAPLLKALGASLVAALLTCAPAHARQVLTCSASPQEFAKAYNYVLGTQAIGGPYQFTNESALLEQAREVRGMGSNLLKLSLAPGAAPRYGSAEAARSAVTTLDYIKGSKPVQMAFDMDFTYYQAWVHTFTKGEWRDGVSPKEARAYYDEMYDLTSWLLTRYSGTGKTFMLGNWEGDWMLAGRQSRDATPSMKAVEGMIDWLNIRQQAVDDAKAAVAHQGVDVFHYVEVNLVKKAMEGKRSIALSVLPKLNVDLVSYSSYEAIKKSPKPDIATIRESLAEIVDYLEKQMQPKAGLPFSRRVFIGEFGYHANRAKPQSIKDQYLKSRYVMQVAIELDLPFALIWQMYNNEYAPDGTSKEMSLIDEAGQKRALYHLHQHYLRAMQAFVAESCRQTGEVPSHDLFKAKALEVLAGSTFGKMDALANQEIAN